MEKWSVLGASRGMGREFSRTASRLMGPALELQIGARKEVLLKSLQHELSILDVKAKYSLWDFTREENQTDIFDEIKCFEPQRLFYFAGGGPFGKFETKNWKDHDWAYKLNLLFPARLIFESFNWPSVRQWVFVGSSVAEDTADPMASSYASSKHGLLGLIKSLRQESSRDIRLFSPGYMDTDLLPANAKVRQEGVLWSPEDAAEQLFNWCKTEASQNFHLTLPRFKS